MHAAGCTTSSVHFYPRSPCGERHLQRLQYVANSCISIHALLAESDFKCSSGNPYKKPYFYPRSPCGERHLHFIDSQFFGFVISIHALLAESDDVSLIYTNRCQDFYPRSPCGERLEAPASWHFRYFLFLSTLSLRRATNWLRTAGVEDDISIHALLAESDRLSWRIVKST